MTRPAFEIRLPRRWMHQSQERFAPRIRDLKDTKILVVDSRHSHAACFVSMRRRGVHAEPELRHVAAGARSDRQSNVAFQNVLLEARPLARFPQLGDMRDAVA